MLQPVGAMQPIQATPSMLGMWRPACPQCGTRMMLARIAPVPNHPDYDRRSFDCPKCGNEHSEVIKFK
jgi:predicted RNA-binding Zn-ribbon protein involved in translation (DUF1610 family)